MDSEHEGQTERTALIGRDSDSDNNAARTQRPKLLTRRIFIIAGAFSARFLFLIGSSFVDLPLLQLQENILCDRFESTGPPYAYSSPLGSGWNRPCNQEAVQKELSVLRQWFIMADLLPTLLAGVPMGIIADRYGRTLVLGLSLFGGTLAVVASVLICTFPQVFPLRLIWLTPILSLIGGGEVTVATIVYAIVADVTDESNRSVTFSLFVAAETIGGVLQNPLAYLMMKAGIWISVFVGLSIMAISIPLGFCLPETLGKGARVEDTSAAEQQPEDLLTDNGENDHGVLQTAITQAKAGWQQFLHLLHLLVTKEHQVGLLLLSKLFSTFGKDAALMLVQYVHIKFGWEWAEAGLVLSAQQIVSFILYTALIPFATNLLSKYGLGPRNKDLLLTKASAVLQIVGGFTVALAATPAALISGVAISGLATGYSIFVRSLMTSLMVNDIGILYTVISIQEALGIFIANPLLSVLFRRGIDLGGRWVGLPFVMAALLYTAALCIIAWIRVDEAGEGGDDGSSDGDSPRRGTQEDTE
ncbi:major facilitator superfamily domain-containing protein [Cercophora newfieldiana]|uniref:Major facilitator superfamily domain-containing protein n=1 Tax=Cercophora newfieldiana TaxID=92897 RepID=A0AA39YC10_9PEZI|nr:major facilitator superfamily domain-containing protein [Cercophora newfieldiana]